MNKETSHTQGAKQAVVVFLLPCFLVGLAWFMYFSDSFIPEGRTNKGELMLPPKQLDHLALQQNGEDFGSKQLDSHWAIMLFGSDNCASETCKDVLYKTRQVHIGLGREADRVKRIYVADSEPVVSEAFVKEYPDVLWLEGDSKKIEKTLSTDQWPDNYFFIIDPLGNIMMRYQPEQNGGDLLRDMQKLLRASNIG